MKPVAWVSSRIESVNRTLLILSLWLVALPACLYVLYLYARPSGTEPPPPVAQVQRWVEPVQGYRFDKEGFARMAAHPPDFTQARWTSVTLPDSIVLPASTDVPDDAPMARAWFRVTYTPPQDLPPGESISLHVTRIMGGAWSVWVNGQLHTQNLEDWRMQWNKPLLVKLPYAQTRPGELMEVMVAVPHREVLGYAFGSLSIGSSDAVRPLYETRVFWQETLPRAGIMVVLLLGGLSFLFWLVRRHETPHLLMAVTALAWFICNLQYFTDFSDDPIASLWFGALVDASVSWFFILLYLFAFRFDPRRLPGVEFTLMAYALAMTLATLPVWQWEKSALVLQHEFNLATGVLTTLFLSWLALRGGGIEFRLIVLSLWSLLIFGGYDIHSLTNQRTPDSIHLFPYCTFIVFGAFLFSIERRYLLAMSGIETLNQTQEQRLREQEGQLEAQHLQLRQIEHEQTLLKERQRLMRDMHDGLGSTLMSSLAAVEQGRMPPPQLAGVLRECVDDLKLVIDSLEPIGHDLATLLATLRYRIGTRLESAGLVIHWRMEDDLPALPWLEPPQALQVLRILQEALTNILKHAQAGEVHIDARPAQQGGKDGILVQVSDNGRGRAPDTPPGGRGLKNMQERARRLGAGLELTSSPDQGMRVDLFLPFDAVPVEDF